MIRTIEVLLVIIIISGAFIGVCLLRGFANAKTGFTNKS